MGRGGARIGGNSSSLEQNIINLNVTLNPSIPTQIISHSQVEFRSRRFAGTDPDHGVRRSVATTAHFEMEPCPYILGASSSSAWEQCPCFLCPTCMQLEYCDTYYHHNVSVARCFVSLCQLHHGSPNHPLQDESMPQYFRGIFHSCMGTMAMLFTSVINLIWKLQDIANNYKWGVLLGGDAVVCHPFHSPKRPLQVETRSQYFAGIFNSYIGTRSILFRPHVHVDW